MCLHMISVLCINLHTFSSILSCKCIIMSIHVTPYIIYVRFPYTILFTTPIFPYHEKQAYSGTKPIGMQQFILLGKTVNIHLHVPYNVQHFTYVRWGSWLV